MKRHHFRGDNASHGASKSHRSGGSTGQRDAPGKVYLPSSSFCAIHYDIGNCLVSKFSCVFIFLLFQQTNFIIFHCLLHKQFSKL
jgi:hypothetical protein